MMDPQFCGLFVPVIIVGRACVDSLQTGPALLFPFFCNSVPARGRGERESLI